MVELSNRFREYVASKTLSGKPISEQDFLHVTGALAAIAPWLGWREGGRNVFTTLGGPSITDGAQTGHALIDEVLAVAPSPESRAAIGDLLERFADGDPRFDTRYPHLLVDRFPANARVPADEPIPGFVRIPEGDFMMGHASETNNKGETDNRPRTVNINDDFYIARTLTTVGQYTRFIDASCYSDGSAKFWGSEGLKWLGKGTKDAKSAPHRWAEQRAHANRPVVGIRWFEARAYARWLSAIMATELAAVSKDPTFQVRLPTEAQWERAARASSASGWHEQRWPFGDNENSVPQQANVRGSDIGSVSGVGVFSPNPIGLYDMAGNAWEWMDNVYQSDSPETFARVGADDKPSGNLSLRGGSWFSRPERASCSYRGWRHPDYWDDFIGFRVVLSLAENEN